jgi:cytochrome c556
VREFHAPSPEEIARIGALPETAKTPALVNAMVAIDERFDALKSAQTAGWKTPEAEADTAPAHQATLLWEQLRELTRTEETAKRPDDFRKLLTDSEHAAAALRDTLRTSPGDTAKLDPALKQTTQSCTACHKAYRNEKK